MLTYQAKGSFKNTERFIAKMRRNDLFSKLNGVANRGVAALAAATPVDTGDTAASWGFKIESSRGSHTIAFTNSAMAGGTPIVIMLQYGHGTGTGGYVEGRDFINPAIAPIFDQIVEEAWEVVQNA